MGTASAAVACVAMLIFDTELASLFSTDPQIVALICDVMPVFVIAVLVSAIQLMFSATLEAMARAQLLAVVTLIGAWAVLLPMSWFLGVTPKFGLNGLWAAAGIGEGTKLVLFSYFLSKTNWEDEAFAASNNAEGGAAGDEDAVSAAAASQKYASTPTMGRSPGTSLMLTPGMWRTKSCTATSSRTFLSFPPHPPPLSLQCARRRRVSMAKLRRLP